MRRPLHHAAINIMEFKFKLPSLNDSFWRQLLATAFGGSFWRQLLATAFGDSFGRQLLATASEVRSI
jgi:hypothetical protein